ncbi:S-adenosylmethionine decarboxylase (ADOMETDC) [Trypanosoma theileri]|uniref:S-adenosylmethionine decarboxylase proenzyme n=1 Tax=Trypanosoma theileri TaxID=67003 RepID=A0A1X0P1E2_9TRYP|nr:S-adenosylmethionine decarboxylase (ADOMETDC) [Trypanosoma theileri]ORC90747.1 S-adenosylmethionine decarboxylase (ADOMETDC) [Trypanosoma theileri]
MSMEKDPLSLMAMWGSVEGHNPQQGFSFEGPEKRLEVIMRFQENTHVDGLLAHEDGVWADAVGALNAQIVSKERNEYIRSYVLTESSLFVMKDRIILITCGTTTLLKSVPHILNAVSAVHGELEWASFMHKNYSFPWEQKGPHASMADEFKELKSYFPSGRPFVLGPVDGDHYFLFLHDDIIRPSVTEKRTQLSMTMYGLDREQTKNWFSDRFLFTGPETAAVRRETKLDQVMDSSWLLHDLLFEPCGYSINAIRGEEYQTIHITPEDHCSFASYETNSSAANYSERMQSVLQVFRPLRFTVIVFLSSESEIGKAYHAEHKIGVEPEFFQEYELQHRSLLEFSQGQTSLKLNYVRRTLDDEIKEN